MVAYTPYQIAELLGQPAPTSQQASVISAPLEPLLVLAGAGSGKTETMAARVVYLVANELVRPEAVLGLTFTRKAAGELLARVQKRLRQLSSSLGLQLDAANQPTISTYNSFAQSVVKEHGLWVGVEPSATLLTEASAWQIMYGLVRNFDGVLETENAISTVTKDLLALDGELSEHLVTLADLEQYLTETTANISVLPWGPRKRAMPKDVKELLESLQLRGQYLQLISEFRKRKTEFDAVTFGDQIAYAAKIANAAPGAALAAQEQYQVVLLDEYQDTSYAQVQFLAGLFGGGHPVTAVGDPNQAIYGWRGASASGLARFPEVFRQGNGKAASVLPLATAWRNDKAILEAANLVAKPLRQLSTMVQVPPLELSPVAGVGQVTSAVVNTSIDEAEVISDWIQQHWAEPPNDEAHSISAAVLCRTRKQFGPIANALAQRGVPYEIVGLGGLLDTPAVVDLVAMLQAASDPSRGDWLVRLLTGPLVNLGAADLQALGSWAAQLAQQQKFKGSVPKNAGVAATTLETERDTGAETNELGDEHSGTETSQNSKAIITDDAEARSLVDAVDNLPPLGQAARDGRVLSAEGHHRLTQLSRSLRNIRQYNYLTLPEICQIAERELGLDIELMVADALGSGRGRADLDAFREVAANYARSVAHPTLAGFLGWLETAQERERGLDMPLVEVNHNAVQLITAHAAKGLEWDVVAVPGLVEGNFPAGNKSAAGRLSRAWLTDSGALPYALRGDAQDLPSINWPQTTQAEVAVAINDLKVEAGAHELASERRLAYVAFTRARHEMLLTGYWWGTQTTPRELSPFLTELVAGGLLSDQYWAAAPVPGAVNPVLAVTNSATWPLPVSDKVNLIRQGAAQVRAALTAQPEPPTLETFTRETFTGEPPTSSSGRLAELAHLSKILLAETGEPQNFEVEFPGQVSASKLVQLAQNRQAFADQLRRPIPTKPSLGAQVGTEFHAWVQGYFEAPPTLFDEDELWGTDDYPVEAGLMKLEQGLADLKTAFQESQWANLRPVAVEQEIQKSIAGVGVIARIDAVFVDPENPEHHIVVDWKTGRPGVSDDERAAREVQLAVYRLAWASLTGQPVEKVNAAFHYVGTNQTVRPAKLLGKEELEALIIGESN